MAKKKNHVLADKWHNSKLRVFLQPYLSWLDNWASFSLYCIRRSSSHTLAYASKVVFIISLIGAIRGIILTRWTATTWASLVGSVVMLIPEILQRSKDIKNNLSEKYVVMMDQKGYYDSGIEAPDEEWRKQTVFTFCDSQYYRTTMFVHDGVNRWLQDEEMQQLVKLRLDKNANKRMKSKLSGSPFDQKYYYFLRFNYRYSQFYAKQFTNEKKWGLCSDLRPEMTNVQVQKTCYFDSYLTNIAPGKVLRSSRSGEIVSSLAETDDDEVAPFAVRSGKKMLKQLDDCTMANEPGVTTLMLLSNGIVPIWIQSNQAQSNPGQRVVAGSGSADWSDCEPFLDQPDGLRKAVITGMERELYEESFGKRAISMEKFKENAKTRILGHFRWLEKSGKTEFVGVTCMDLERAHDSLSPEVSEVFKKGEEITAKTVSQLREALYELAHPVDRAELAMPVQQELEKLRKQDALTEAEQKRKAELERIEADQDRIRQYHLALETVANEELGTVVFSRCNLSSTATILMLADWIDEALQSDPEAGQQNAFRWLSRKIAAK